MNEALRLLRIFHDMPRSILVKELGISSSYLSEIESGAKKNLSLDLLQKYADTFQIPLSSLMFFSEQLSSGKPAETARNAIASRIIKLLSWVAAKDKTASQTRAS